MARSCSPWTAVYGGWHRVFCSRTQLRRIVPGIFGEIASAGSVQAHPAPPPQHDSEILHYAEIPRMQLGVWAPRSVAAADAVFASPGEGIACVCDAELVNQAELRAELQARGVGLRTT